MATEAFLSAEVPSPRSAGWFPERLPPISRWGFTSPEMAVEWFLRFGDKVKVLVPPEMVQRMKDAVNSKYVEGYGWNSAVFTTTEDFWEKRGITISELDVNRSYEKIREQILRLNPMAEEKQIRKFITGSRYKALPQSICFAAGP